MAFVYTIWKGPRYARHLMDKLEYRHGVRIVARFRHYAVLGDNPWWEKLWIDFLIFLLHFAIYFSPFILAGLLGWALGIFKQA